MRCELAVALVGILALNLSVPEFLDLQKLTPQERSERLHLPAACVPQMTAMKTGFRETDRIMVEVRCVESDSAVSAVPAHSAPHARAGAGGVVPSTKP